MGERYRTQKCHHCNSYLENGEMIVVCKTCNTPQHLSCVLSRGKCATYGCARSFADPFKLREDENGEPLPETNEETEQRQREERNAGEKLKAELKHIANEEAFEEYEERQRGSLSWLKPVLIVLLVVGALVGGWFGLHNIRYHNAEKNVKNGDLSYAATVFEMITPAAVGQERYDSLKYKIAQAHLDKGLYRTAYIMFEELGNYRESRDRRQTVILLWATSIVESNEMGAADEFVSTVTLSTADYDLVYKAVDVQMDLVYDSVRWWKNGPKAPVHNCIALLEMLPKDHGYTWVLLDFLKVLKYTDSYEELFVEQDNWIVLMWNLELVEKMANTDDGIGWFMAGRWEDLWGERYISFTKEDDGLLWCQFNLPTPQQSEEVHHYEIENGVYCWEDEDGNLIEKVFSIKIMDYDTVVITVLDTGDSYMLNRVEE